MSEKLEEYLQDLDAFQVELDSFDNKSNNFYQLMKEITDSEENLCKKLNGILDKTSYFQHFGNLLRTDSVRMKSQNNISNFKEQKKQLDNLKATLKTTRESLNGKGTWRSITGFQKIEKDLKSIQGSSSEMLKALLKINNEMKKIKSAFEKDHGLPEVDENFTRAEVFSRILSPTNTEGPESYIWDNFSEIRKLAVRCIEIIEKNLGTPGLYRLAGQEKNIREIIDKYPRDDIITEDTYIHDITNSFKRSCRLLRHPIVPVLYHAEIFDLFLTKTPPKEETCTSLINILYDCRDTFGDLDFIMQHLIKVANKSQENSMTSSNISIVFSASLFGNTEKVNERNEAVRFMIDNYTEVFDGVKNKLLRDNNISRTFSSESS